MRQDFHTLLSRLGEAMGLPGLEPDEAGVVDLVFDQSLAVRLACDEAAGEVIAFAEVGEAPMSAPTERLEALLRANHLWHGTAGAAFALDGERVVLARQWPLATLDLPRWEQHLARFVATATAWRDRLAAPTAAAPAEIPAGMRV